MTAAPIHVLLGISDRHHEDISVQMASVLTKSRIAEFSLSCSWLERGGHGDVTTDELHSLVQCLSLRSEDHENRVQSPQSTARLDPTEHQHFPAVPVVPPPQTQGPALEAHRGAQRGEQKAREPRYFPRSRIRLVVVATFVSSDDCSLHHLHQARTDDISQQGCACVRVAPTCVHPWAKTIKNEKNSVFEKAPGILLTSVTVQGGCEIPSNLLRTVRLTPPSVPTQSCVCGSAGQGPRAPVHARMFAVHCGKEVLLQQVHVNHADGDLRPRCGGKKLETSWLAV